MTCLRCSQKPKPQKIGQLPTERITVDIVFENVVLNNSGPIFVKYRYIRKPTLVKAVHIELVSDLSSKAFIAALHHFVSRRGKPKVI